MLKPIVLASLAALAVGSLACSGSPRPDPAGDGDASVGPVTSAAPASVSCPSYCACLTPVCGGSPVYPFADDAACRRACETFGAPERSCLPKWCERARTASGATAEHLCEHAWGGLGLQECEAL